jgi:hypothetical protein
MVNHQATLDSLIQKLKQNVELLMATQEVSLSKAKLPKSPGVYMLFFEENYNT